MIDLPDVTVVALDTVAHTLVRMALEETLQRIRPAAVVVISDSTQAVPEPRNCHVRYYHFRPFSSVDEAMTLLWRDVPNLVWTSHYLTVQWDGWVVNPEMWSDDFLKYDYIGAPWYWWPPQKRVGNGGFSLRSQRMTKYVADNMEALPYEYPEDQTLCHKYRPLLEAEGFVWAPEEVAQRFSFEHGRPAEFTPFVFHDLRNWPWFMDDDGLATRLSHASEYVRGKQSLVDEMMKVRPVIRSMQEDRA